MAEEQQEDPRTEFEKKTEDMARRSGLMLLK